MFVFLLGCGQTSLYFYSSLSSESETIEFQDNLEEETFKIGENGSHPLDILIVVDSSSSMNSHLQNLGRSLKDLLSVISTYDWQIAFTTVDHGDHEQVSQRLFTEQKWQNHVSDNFASFGKLMFLEKNGRMFNKKILTPDMDSYEDIFYQTLSHIPKRECALPPFCHKYLEQPLRSLKSSLERNKLDNNQFFRKTADFVSIIITNEDERSEDPKRATKAEDVVQTFNTIFHASKTFLSFGILVNDQKCLRKELDQNKKAEVARRIGVLATLTGGDNLSICNENHGANLKKISHIIKKHMERSVMLRREPHPDSVEVDFLEGPSMPWLLSGKRLVFKGGLGKNSKILVRYQALED